MDKITVSVCMITYGHEQYIKEAIESVLMQSADFEYELIIADDCSPDATEKVVKLLIETHENGHRIKYIKHQSNLGMMPNFEFALKQCKGKYIALCDGDDYWTDALKLQKQVDFLEANLEYGICFHNVKVFNQAKGELEADTITRQVPETTTILELAKGNFMHTPSVMLRNDFKTPKWFKKSPLGDWVLYMLAINDRKIKKIDEVMAVYRLHGESVWSNKSQETRNRLTNKSVQIIYKQLKSEFSTPTKNILQSRLEVSDPDYLFFLKKIYRKLFR